MADATRSGPLQVIPAGLLGFFNLKNGGRNPQALVDELQPILDLTEWYLSTSSDDPTALSAVNIANGDNGYFDFSTNPISVPQNEWWWVEQYSVVTEDLVAGESIALCPAMQRPFPAAVRTQLLGDQVLATGPDGNAGSFMLRPFFAPPGSNFGVWVRGCATGGGTVTTFGCIRFARLRI